MAKIIIEIEDKLDGRVLTKCTPNFETMMMMEVSGNSLTPAHGYALTALNAIIRENKNNAPTKILIPRIGA